ncbi:MAG: hypothetical protein PHT60_09320 [Acidiphilium sp.]|nr:hypothetical protein [Acidiphilium sp.]MDD4935962.1 hypothetical protein [Acidiphilium sp.]
MIRVERSTTDNQVVAPCPLKKTAGMRAGAGAQPPQNKVFYFFSKKMGFS